MTRRRAARSLVSFTVCFAFGQVAFAAALEWRLSHFGAGERTAQRERLAAQAASGHPLLLALGSSRTQSAFFPHAFAGLRRAGGAELLPCNFGLTANGPLLLWLTRRQLERAGYRPAVLLVEVLPAALNAPAGKVMSVDEWLDGMRLSAADLWELRPYLSRGPRLPLDWLRHRWRVGYEYRTTWRSYAGLDAPADELAGLDPAGWLPLDKPVASRDRAILAGWQLVQFGPALTHFRLCDRAARALHELATEANAAGACVAFVCYPESSEFRAAYSPAAAAQLQEFLASLRRAGHGVFDARAWLADDEFRDGHHALMAGATRFSHRLAAELGSWLLEDDHAP